MLAILIASGLAIAVVIAFGLMRAPRLTDDQVQQLVDEYWVCEFLGDEPRAHELWRDLDREGIVMRVTDDGVKWERR